VSSYFCAATTLTSWHLLVTFCSLHVALKVKLFEHKPFDRKAVMGFGILNGISIGLLNLSLGFNSVGFYQVLLLLFALFWHLIYISFVLSAFFPRFWTTLTVFLNPDDQAGNHPLHCFLGDPFPWEEIQVSLETLLPSYD
jgi:solute carrier family 35 protein E3